MPFLFIDMRGRCVFVEEEMVAYPLNDDDDATE